MNNLMERLVPAVAAALSMAVGVLMLVLLNDARASGLAALEESLVGEVSAIARSQDQRVASNLSGGAGLARQPWELTVGSQIDQGLLNDLLQFVPDLRTGFFVTDSSLRITQGVNLEDASIIGDTYDRAGAQQLVASEGFNAGAGGFLSVASGLTSDVPTIAQVYPILDPATGALRGTFIFENEVAVDSTFNEEISQLGRGETGRYLFYDSRGTVIASNETALIASRVPDDRFLDASPGRFDLGDDVVVVQDVPSAGWRIAFVQDRGEFESGLAGPLQSVGRIIVAAFVVIGGLLFVVLARRLRAARLEQERLTKLNESQEEFISIVSHELRTPVAGVLGFLQTSLDHWETMSDEARHAAVSRSASNARRLQSLTRDVLDSQAAESGRMTFSMDDVDIIEEVRVAVDAARTLYPDRDIVFESEAVFRVRADVDRIQQVLTNLLDNAIRVSPPSSAIEVDVGSDDETATISVRDHGPGLPEGGEERIFEKFVRGTSSGVSGTGLGLFISRQIVEAHNGTIGVESPPEGGARFVVRLPAHAGRARARAGGVEPPDAAP